MTGKRLFRLVRRKVIGLPHNEKMRRVTLEKLASYISYLKHKEGRNLSANNNLKPWDYAKDSEA